MAAFTTDDVSTHISSGKNNAMSLDASASTSALLMASDANEPIQVFRFFELSRELRDTIYDQPCMLDDKLIIAQNEEPESDVYYNDPGNRLRIQAKKPETNLLLVSHKFADEYKERCKGRIELFVRTHPERFLREMWSKDAALQLNVLNLHLGVFHFGGLTGEEVIRELEDVELRLKHLCNQLPYLRTVYLKLYIANHNVSLNAFEEWLRSMVLMSALEQLKIVSCSDPAKCWDLASPKYLLVDWKAGQLKAPAVVAEWDSSTEYAESCCKGLSYDSPRVGDEMLDEWGHSLGKMGTNGEVIRMEYGGRPWDGYSDYDYDERYLGDDETKADIYTDYLRGYESES